MKKLLSPLLALLLLACQEQPFEKAAVETEVRQMLNEYHAYTQEKGLIGEFKYLDNSEDFFWVPPGFGSALDYKSIKEILEENDKLIRSIEFKWISLQVYPLSNKIATYNGVVESRMTDTSGLSSLTKFLESGTLIKRKDGWKLLSGQSRVLE